jgi:hypothetical protein
MEGFEMRVNSELQIANCKLQIANCGAGCRTSRSPLPAPRSAISLTEVLIAMGILTVGLLGVAALFPVGGFYMMKAEIADRGAAIAQSVMSDIQARGMLNPTAWCVMTPAPESAATAPANKIFNGFDGKYCPTQSTIAWSFTRPFAITLAEGLRVSAAASASGLPDPVVICKQFGSAYVIDPMGATALSALSPSPQFQPFNWNHLAYPFPAWVSPAFAPPMGAYYSCTAWNPWRASDKDQFIWPIRRVTFQQADGWSMDARVAEHYFRGKDDLATEFPPRADHPAAQTWDKADLNGNGIPDPLSRQWTGDYSWIVSVVPTSNAARDALARSPESYSYDVSVVVFYKRILPPTPTQNLSNADATSSAKTERLVNARIISTGLNGGELLLHKLDTVAESPFSQLKAGQWIMLCGPHPNSTTSEPRFVMNWYQVLSIDAEGTNVTGFNPSTDRIVAVRGPEWPWQPASNLSSSELSNQLCSGIIRGAVAVHTKTLRLNSLTSGGGAAGGMTLVRPPGSTDPKYGIY